MCQTTYLTKRSPRGTRSVGKLRTPVSTTIAILSLLLPQGYSILINIYGKPSLSHLTPRYPISYHLAPLCYLSILRLPCTTPTVTLTLTTIGLSVILLYVTTVSVSNVSVIILTLIRSSVY